MPGVAFYRYSLANPAAELPELRSSCIFRRQLAHPVTKSKMICGIGELPLLDAPVRGRKLSLNRLVNWPIH
jgi:hypothetical protein